MGRGQLIYVMLTGRLDGKRGSGRPKETMLYMLASWHKGMFVSEMIGYTLAKLPAMR